jgi:hypothetical protein
MTEVDERATICKGCGAVKMLVRQPMGYAKGCLMIGALLLTFVFALAGRYSALAICAGVVAVLFYTQPRRLMWVRRTVELS